MHKSYGDRWCEPITHGYALCLFMIAGSETNVVVSQHVGKKCLYVS